MRDDEDSQPAGAPAPVFKRRIDQRIDQILELATADRAAAIRAALRLRKWLQQQMTTAQAELDRQELLKEVGHMIDLLRKG